MIAGHTNDEFICEIDGKTVTMADNAGRLFTDIDVTLDKKTKDMTVVGCEQLPSLQTPPTILRCRPSSTSTTRLSAPLANAVIGSITADIIRT